MRRIVVITTAAALVILYLIVAFAAFKTLIRTSAPLTDNTAERIVLQQCANGTGMSSRDLEELIANVRKEAAEQIKPPPVEAAALTPLIPRANDSLIISYNLCRIQDDLNMNYTKQDGHDALPWPYLRFKSYQRNGPIRNEYARLYVHETRYDYGDGNLVLLTTIFSDDWNEAALGQDHYHQVKQARTQYEQIRETLACWDSITRTVVPITMRYYIASAHTEYSCPFPGFPSPIPPELSSYEVILLHGYKGVLLEQVTPEFVMDTAHSTSFVRLPICAHRRPVVDWTWCSNGIQGTGLEVQLNEFVLYQHAVGMDRLVFYDDDGLYLKTLKPYIDSGIVHYYRSPRLFNGQPQGYIQDVLMEICRARYWYGTRWIGFWDIDEFPVFNRETDAAYSFQKILDGLESEDATQAIPFDTNVFMTDINVTVTAPVSPPYMPSMLNIATVRMQNLPSNRRYHLVATALHECMMTIVIAPDKAPSLVERYIECNRLHDETKYWFRAAQGHCKLAGHDPNCPEYETSDYKRRDRIMLAHYFNAIVQREAPHPTHLHIPVSNVVEIVQYMKNNRTILHKPIRYSQT